MRARLAECPALSTAKRDSVPVTFSVTFAPNQP
jgi:hypothetical protein